MDEFTVDQLLALAADHAAMAHDASQPDGDDAVTGPRVRAAALHAQVAMALAAVVTAYNGRPSQMRPPTSFALKAEER